MTRLKKLNKYNPMSILFLLLKNRKKILKEEQDETFKKICSRQMPLFKEAYQSLSDVLVVQEEKEYLALQELLFEIPFIEVAQDESDVLRHLIRKFHKMAKEYSKIQEWGKRSKVMTAIALLTAIDYSNYELNNL